MPAKIKSLINDIKDYWNNLSKTKKILFVSASTLLFLVAITIVIIYPTDKPVFFDESKKQGEISIREAPKVRFDLYTITNPPQINLTNLSNYKLKTDFSDEEVQRIASVLGINAGNSSYQSDKAVLFDLKEGLLDFDKKTGGFNFLSLKTVKTSATDPQGAAVELLQETGIYDETIECGITYKRKNAPDTTFVECHRNWEKLGAPLLTLPGILNGAGLNTNNLAVGKIDQYAPDDYDVYDVSTGENGRARPDDFNTITVAVKNQNSIITVQSTMRWVENKTPIDPNKFITYSKALEMLSNGETSLSLVVPDLSGDKDWDTVFPENKAFSNIADVRDLKVIYLEKMSGERQREYSPVYLVYGTADIESGNTVKFVQAVPAEVGVSEVLAVSTGSAEIDTDTERRSLQLRDFIPETPESSTPAPSVPPEVKENVDCREGVYSLDDPSKPWRNLPNFTLSIPGYGNMVVVRKPGAPHTLFVKTTDAADSSLEAARDAVYQAIGDQYLINYLNTRGTGDDVRLKDYGSLKNFYETRFPRINPAIPYPAFNEFPEYWMTVAEPGSRYRNAAESFEKRAIDADNGKTVNVQSPGFPPEILDSISLLTSLDGASDRWQKCYLTGGSPFIFLYPERTIDVSVKTSPNTTYTYPETDDEWHVTVNKNGEIENVGESLYYEFDEDKTNLLSTNVGYSVKIDRLRNLIERMANELGLNSNESKALNTELKNTAGRLGDTEYITLKLVKQEELGSKLSIKIKPNPDNLVRIHFLVSATNTLQSINEPKFEKIKRSGFTVVEIGASKK